MLREWFFKESKYRFFQNVMQQVKKKQQMFDICKIGKFDWPYTVTIRFETHTNYE